MRQTFSFFNEVIKETIEIVVYFENDYYQKDLDNFRLELELRLKSSGWLITNKNLSNGFPRGYVKRYMKTYVEESKKEMAME